MERGDLPAECRGYEVRDPDGAKVGKVDEVFVNEDDDPEYLGIKTGLIGGKLTLVPASVARAGEVRRTIEVSESKDRIKDAPTIGSKEEITTQLEDEIQTHFGLDSSGKPPAQPEAEQSTEQDTGQDTEDQPSDTTEPQSLESNPEETAEPIADDDRAHSESQEEITEPHDYHEAREEDHDRGEDRDAASRTSGERESVRVSVWRERARAEKVLGEDGAEELRIRKDWVEEEETVEVEDHQS